MSRKIGASSAPRTGMARIDGTRIRVVDLAIAQQQGYTLEEICTPFSSRPLLPTEVHAALVYHHDHAEELDHAPRQLAR